jgi:hypothetical protein
MDNEKPHITIDATAIPLHLYSQTPPGLSEEELERRRARIAEQMAVFARVSEALIARDRETIERIGGVKRTTIGQYGEVEYYVYRENVNVVLSHATESVLMTPQEALSLLAWLEQEKSMLEQLAKEQEA